MIIIISAFGVQSVLYTFDGIIECNVYLNDIPHEEFVYLGREPLKNLEITIPSVSLEPGEYKEIYVGNLYTTNTINRSWYDVSFTYNNSWFNEPMSPYYGFTYGINIYISEYIWYFENITLLTWQSNEYCPKTFSNYTIKVWFNVDENMIITDEFLPITIDVDITDYGIYDI